MEDNAFSSLLIACINYVTYIDTDTPLRKMIGRLFICNACVYTHTTIYVRTCVMIANLIFYVCMFCRKEYNNFTSAHLQEGSK